MANFSKHLPHASHRIRDFSALTDKTERPSLCEMKEIGTALATSFSGSRGENGKQDVTFDPLLAGFGPSRKMKR